MTAVSFCHSSFLTLFFLLLLPSYLLPMLWCGSSTWHSPFLEVCLLSWGLIHGLQFLEGAYLLWHGRLQAAAPLGVCLLCRGAPPTPLTLFPPPPSLQHFLPFLKYLFTEVPQSPPTSSLLACGVSIADLAGTGCDRLWPWLSRMNANSAAPHPLP